MKVLREVYDKLESEIEAMKAELKEKQQIRDERRSENDLRENEEYQRVTEEVQQLSQEILDKIRLKESAEIVETVTSFDKLDIGCKFKCTIKSTGNRLHGVKEIDYGCTHAYYDEKTNTTISERILTLGGPVESNIKDGILSSESPLGKFLLKGNIGVGKHVMVNTNHEYETIIIEYVD